MFLPNRVVVRDVMKRENLENGGYRMIVTGKEQVTYGTEINEWELDDMARRAARSKGQKSRDGALKVTIVKRVQLPA